MYICMGGGGEIGCIEGKTGEGNIWGVNEVWFLGKYYIFIVRPLF